MKKTLIFTSLIFLFMQIPATAASEWPPSRLTELENSLLGLHAQFKTLDDFSPVNFPDFKELEITNQLVEKMDFNKRKFELLITSYNILEDKIFPLLKELSQKNPADINRIIRRLNRYSQQPGSNILLVQKEINQLALTIDRLEKQLERRQSGSGKASELLAEIEAKSRDTSISISARLEQLNNDTDRLEKAIGAEKEKLAELKKKQTRQKAKIDEKQTEISSMKKELSAKENAAVRKINRLFAEVRQIRLNGLEIPKLNTTRTLIYLSQNHVRSLAKKRNAIDDEIKNLRIQRRRELQKQVLRGILVIFIALGVIFILVGVSRRISKRIMAGIEKSDALDAHRKQRYQTLSSVLLSIIKITIWVLGVLWVLGELDIDYAPFLVAAGGLSLAIGFGAQSLVKDFVSGFFMLMEEQLALGDVVDINGKVGTVEKISFRTIRMRSLDGTVHIIPNGGIANVSNLTHKWSRAVVNVGVSYDHDSEKVLQIMEKICLDIYQDPEWKQFILEQPLPQGILSFGDSAVNFRILAKTSPGQQWAVDREIRVRLKKAFDKNGIEIPYNFINLINRTPENS